MLPQNVMQADELLLIGPMAQKRLPDVIAQKGALQVAVDGGIAAASHAAVWFGDADSGTRPAHMPSFLKTSQDMTDLAFTLESLQDGAWRRLYLYGFAGGRHDHALANIGEIDAAMRARPSFEQAVFYDAAGRVMRRHFTAGAQSFKCEGTFSLFALSPAVVSISGACAYPAHRMSLPVLSGRGVSNSGSGDVRIESDVPVIVIFPQE